MSRVYSQDTPDQYPEEYSLEDMVEFADNPEPRCPCVLILDTSGSMHGPRIRALNDGIRTFKHELQKDTLAALRVEVATIVYEGLDGLGKAILFQDFVTSDNYTTPKLKASGGNFEAQAIQMALSIIESRKRRYRDSGISYYRPWIILICDGGLTEPSDQIEAASQMIKDAEQDKRVAFFAIGVEGADMEQLAQLSHREPLRLRGLAFKELFVWLSGSMSRVSSSRPGDEVQLDVGGLKSWAAI